MLQIHVGLILIVVLINCFFCSYSDDTVTDLNSKVLFSADKNFVILQNHAKELKLIELKHH